MRRASLVLVRRAVGLAMLVLVCGLVTLAVSVQVATGQGYTSYVVNGGSMEPSVSMGTLVFVQAVDPAAITSGDVIAVRTDAGPVYTHRVVGAEGSGSAREFRTKGDANPSPDPQPVPARAVAGRLALAVPVAGFAVAMLRIQSGVVCIVSLLGALLLVYWLLDDLEPPKARRTASKPSPRPVPTT